MAVERWAERLKGQTQRHGSRAPDQEDRMATLRPRDLVIAPGGPLVRRSTAETGGGGPRTRPTRRLRPCRLESPVLRTPGVRDRARRGRWACRDDPVVRPPDGIHLAGLQVRRAHYAHR